MKDWRKGFNLKFVEREYTGSLLYSEEWKASPFLVKIFIRNLLAKNKEKILTDMALMGKTIPKYSSQGWTHWIDEYVRKHGLDPVKIRKETDE